MCIRSSSSSVICKRSTSIEISYPYTLLMLLPLHFSRDMACCVAGITSDANVLTNELRAFAQRHTLQFGEPIPCEQLVMRLCDIKQAYTQTGGLYFLCQLYDCKVLIFNVMMWVRAYYCWLQSRRHGMVCESSLPLPIMMQKNFCRSLIGPSLCRASTTRRNKMCRAGIY